MKAMMFVSLLGIGSCLLTRNWTGAAWAFNLIMTWTGLRLEKRK